ncbi:MAG: metal-dependent hydrolase, partial [Nitrospirota bacterium]|nr:metal-dependent hydrolase [Nitrospirota bacterium]
MITGTSKTDDLPAIDIHVHVASIDPATGCYISPRLYNSLIFRFLRWQLGISSSDTPAGADAKFQKRFQREMEGMHSLQQCVILALDSVYDSSGERDLGASTFYIPNDYIFRLCKEDSRLLPGASINPLRPDAIDELERCRERGAVLVKWLPNTQGFD